MNNTIKSEIKVRKVPCLMNYAKANARTNSKQFDEFSLWNDNSDERKKKKSGFVHGKFTCL